MFNRASQTDLVLLLNQQAKIIDALSRAGVPLDEMSKDYLTLVKEHTGVDLSDISTNGGGLQKTDFDDWLGLLSRQKIKPTIRPTRQYILSLARKSTRIQNISIVTAESIAQTWLYQAEKAGVIVRNPERGAGKAKYVLNNSVKAFSPR